MILFYYWKESEQYICNPVLGNCQSSGPGHNSFFLQFTFSVKQKWLKINVLKTKGNSTASFPINLKQI